LGFVAGAKTVTAANKGKSEGGGFYFPLAGEEQRRGVR